MTDWDFIIAPAHVSVSFNVEPVPIMLHSLHMLNQLEMFSGLGSWLVETNAAMSPEQRADHNLVFGPMADALYTNLESEDFPSFIDNIATQDPVELRDRSLNWMRKKPYYPGDAALLADESTYFSFIRQVVSEKEGEEFDEPLVHRAYAHLTNPILMQQLIVKHLRMLWDQYAAVEWKRIKPVLEEAVTSLNRRSYEGLTAYEAIETVTGRDMRGNEKFNEMMSGVKRLVFMPSPYLGPYIGWHPQEEGSEQMVLLVGLRQPSSAQSAPSVLNRSELLVRLNALADDTRLRIMELLVQRGEICAQDFITELDLSQSSASRHLRQLTASGFLNERRRDVAKCYTLNPDRIDDTIKALEHFLHDTGR